MDRTHTTEPDPAQVDFGLVLLDQFGDPLCTVADTADLEAESVAMATPGPPPTKRAADR